jgi:predicted dehydrogenase
MTRHRVAIVGAGIGAEHLTGYLANAERFDVAAICDLDATRAESLVQRAREGGSATHYADELDAVLADSSLDVIDICLPPQMHKQTILKALSADKHVVCEKPLVASLAEVDEIAQALSNTDRLLMPVFQYRFGNGMGALLELMDSGLTGKPLVATIETHWNRLSDYYEVPWRGKWATELGGAVVGHAIHNHDLLMRVLGPVASVQAELATRVNPIETEDCASIICRMRSGALVTSSVTLGSASDQSRLRFCFEHVTAESGLEPYNPGTAAWQFQARGSESSLAEKQVAIDDVVKAHIPHVEGYARQFERLDQALRGQANLPVTLDDARASLELITAIYAAHATGTRVDLPLSAHSPGYTDWSIAAADATESAIHGPAG